jgi:hypothetical protein
MPGAAVIAPDADAGVSILDREAVEGIEQAGMDGFESLTDSQVKFA